jgi:hypothetical protein
MANKFTCCVDGPTRARHVGRQALSGIMVEELRAWRRFIDPRCDNRASEFVHPAS